ncbi:MAG: helix-turn-helix transcriptional regulator, partial [Planctomycetota bacterium]
MDKICGIIDKLIEWINPLERFSIPYVGEEHNVVSTRPRPYLEIGFNDSSETVELIAGDKSVTFKPGMLALLNAHFGNRIVSKGKFKYFCISFDIDGVALFKELQKEPLLLVTALANYQAADYYREIIYTDKHDTALKDIRMKVEIQRFLFSILDLLTGSGEKGNRYSGPVQKAIDYMYRNYSRPELALRDLAAAANLSHIHFGRQFKKETGLPPVKYLTRYRLQKAEELLKRSDLLIGEVGRMTGFADRLHFSRIFKKHSG